MEESYAVSAQPCPINCILVLGSGLARGSFASTSNCSGKAALTQCTAYVKGFVEGALLTDSAILAALESIETDHSAFFLRAYRSRLGIKAQSIVPSTFVARFCLPEHTDIEKLAGSLAELFIDDSAAISTDERLYAYLQSDYPCGNTQEASR